MAARYFKRHWAETRGDEHDAWGPATYYFETDDEGWPTRHVEVYAKPDVRSAAWPRAGVSSKVWLAGLSIGHVQGNRSWQ